MLQKSLFFVLIFGILELAVLIKSKEFYTFKTFICLSMLFLERRNFDFMKNKTGDMS